MALEAPKTFPLGLALRPPLDMLQQAPLELCQLLAIVYICPLRYVGVKGSLVTRAGVVKGDFVEAQHLAY